MVKNTGARSSQLVPCSKFGIFVIISSDCNAWEIYLPDEQRFVTSCHIVVETDMSKRLALIEKFDLVMEKPGPMGQRQSLCRGDPFPLLQVRRRHARHARSN